MIDITLIIKILNVVHKTVLNKIDISKTAETYTYYSGERRLLDDLQQTTAALSPKPKAAFHVQLVHDLICVGNYQKIVFDLVMTNVGNGYNKVDGLFTAPTSGTYILSWTSASADNLHMQTELLVNNQVVGLAWSDAGNHSDFVLASNTVIVELNSGDVVWVRSNKVHHNTLHGQHMSTFSGWFLYSM